jgi:hypothetical protein
LGCNQDKQAEEFTNLLVHDIHQIQLFGFRKKKPFFLSFSSIASVQAPTMFSFKDEVKSNRSKATGVRGGKSNKWAKQVGATPTSPHRIPSSHRSPQFHIESDDRNVGCWMRLGLWVVSTSVCVWVEWGPERSSNQGLDVGVVVVPTMATHSPTRPPYL